MQLIIVQLAEWVIPADQHGPSSTSGRPAGSRQYPHPSTAVDRIHYVPVWG